VLSGEEAARQRIVGNDRDAFFLAERKQIALEAAKEQIVARLHGIDAHQILHFAAAERARHAMRHPVRDADIARLAGFHDGVERFQRLVDRRGGIETVQLIEVDIVRLQPLQRGVDRIEDVLSRHALVPGFGTHLADAFRGEHEAARLPLSQRPRISSVRPAVVRSPPNG
jgi:hypothetical protein